MKMDKNKTVMIVMRDPGDPGVFDPQSRWFEDKSSEPIIRSRRTVIGLTRPAGFISVGKVSRQSRNQRLFKEASLHRERPLQLIRYLGPRSVSHA